MCVCATGRASGGSRGSELRWPIFPGSWGCRWFASTLPTALACAGLDRAPGLCSSLPAACREMASTADIVFMPYNYLIDAKTRGGLGIQWANAVLIFDEAHNVEVGGNARPNLLLGR